MIIKLKPFDQVSTSLHPASFFQTDDTDDVWMQSPLENLYQTMMFENCRAAKCDVTTVHFGF